MKITGYRTESFYFYRIAVGPQQGRKLFSLNAGNAGKARKS